MTTLRETSLPIELLQLREGEIVVGYQILDGKITFILQVPKTQGNVTPLQPRKQIGDWIDKWAGTLAFEPGETRESVKAAAMQEKFGS